VAWPVTSANKRMSEQSGWLVIVSELQSVGGAERLVLVATEDNSVTWPARRCCAAVVVVSQSAMIPRALLSLT